MVYKRKQKKNKKNKKKKNTDWRPFLTKSVKQCCNDYADACRYGNEPEYTAEVNELFNEWGDLTNGLSISRHRVPRLETDIQCQTKRCRRNIFMTFWRTKDYDPANSCNFDKDQHPDYINNKNYRHYECDKNWDDGDVIFKCMKADHDMYCTLHFNLIALSFEKASLVYDII